MTGAPPDKATSVASATATPKPKRTRKPPPPYWEVEPFVANCSDLMLNGRSKLTYPPGWYRLRDAEAKARAKARKKAKAEAEAAAEAAALASAAPVQVLPEAEGA